MRKPETMIKILKFSPSDATTNLTKCIKEIPYNESLVTQIRMFENGI